jgi:uncharacterized protein involved in high-affinity Fe2+ transport
MNRWAGLAITLILALSIAGVLFFNLETSTPSPITKPPVPPATAPDPSPSLPASGPSGTFREYPIGDPVERPSEHLEIAAVWFPAVAMEGMPHPGSDVIHLEADVKAAALNPNGFARGQFIPYLKIEYTITPESGEPITGELLPMVARDGLHYGANVAMPASANYHLTYHFDPPSAGGLGRHADPETGVAPWWPPFSVEWDWNYKPVEPQ